MASSIAENVAEGVDNEGHAIVGVGVFVGFPKVDLTNSRTAGNLISSEVDIGGPSLRIGIVGEVGIRTTDRAIARRDEDGSAGDGEILVEARSSHGTTVALPDDVGHMVGVGIAAIIPSGIVGATVVLHTGFDEGATVAIGTADDGAIGADSKAVDLHIVHTAVFIGEEEGVGRT